MKIDENDVAKPKETEAHEGPSKESNEQNSPVQDNIDVDVLVAIMDKIAWEEAVQDNKNYLKYKRTHRDA
jgi:hypothetical protein